MVHVKNAAKKGADFERKVLAHLAGERKNSLDIGWIGTTLLAKVGKGYRDSFFTHVTIAGSRFAGSKGTGGVDLVIVISQFANPEKKTVKNQWVIGVQCKWDKPHPKQIADDMTEMLREGGVIPMYCWNERGKVVIYAEDKWERLLTRIAGWCIV